MKAFGQLALVALILGCTFLAMRTIGQQKNEQAAGGEVYALDAGEPGPRAGFDALLARLREVGEAEVAAQLQARRDKEQLWVARRLGGSRRALYVDSLLVERIYVAERELQARPADLYPGLKVPSAHLEAFAWISLAGTLVHELAHARGVREEKDAYQAEVDWYTRLGQSAWVAGLDPKPREVYDWAIELAIGNAKKALASVS